MDRDPSEVDEDLVLKTGQGPGWIPSIGGTLGLVLAIGIMVHAGSSDDADPARLEIATRLSWRAHSIFSIGWSPDGQQLAASGLGPEIRVWNLDSGLSQTLVSQDDSARFLQGWSADGGELSVSSIEGQMESWKLDSSLSPAIRQPIAGPLSAIARASRGSSIRLWGPTDRRLDLIPLEGRTSNSMAVSTDARTLASAGGDGSIRIFDLETNRLRHRIPTSGVGINSVTISPDGTRLAAGGAGPARIWDLATGRELTSMENLAGGYSVLAFSPDGRRLAGASWGGSIIVWDRETGRELARLSGPRSQVLAMAWSPDGRRLASGGHDATARIWDVSAWK